jgi:anti-anti-sigma factor
MSLSDLGQAEEAAVAIEVRPRAHEVVVVVKGELDLSTVPTLRAVLDGVDPRHRRVVLDMRDVSFLDSMGVGLLVEASRRCASELCELVLRSPSERVRQVLELTGLHDLLLVVGD